MQNTGNLNTVTFIDGYFYLLILPNLYKVYYDPPSNTFKINETVQNDLDILKALQGTSKANLTHDTSLHMLNYVYQNNTKKLYSFKQCTGNYKFNITTGTCDLYACIVTNCVMCNFANDICTTCNTSVNPYVINRLYEC